jgi:hypothetical protein
MKSIYNIYDDRLQDARIENANYAIGLEKATEVLKKELENLYVVKNELYEKVDKGIAEVKNDNTRVVKLFSGYKKNFHVMQHKFTQLSDFIKDIRFRINLKEDVQRREYHHMANMINFDKKNQPGFYDGVYSNKLIKKGLGTQLKDYIEGKITADQLFKKRADHFKSAGSEGMIKNSLNNLGNSNNNINNIEETKYSFIDLFKESLKGKNFPLKKSQSRDTIQEEDDENINNNNELNSVLNKKPKDKNNTKKIEEIKEENSGRTKDKEIIIKPKNEEDKIKIVSIDKDNDIDKDKEKNSDSIKKNLERKSTMKNAIDNLFHVKNIMVNIKNDPNQNQLNENTNSNSKTKTENNKNLVRPMTGNPNMKTNIQNNPLKQNYIKENIQQTDNTKNKNKSNISVENKKENHDKKAKENMYNKTMISLAQNIPPLTANTINKKSNSSNKKNVKYFVKQNNDNANKGNQRAFSGIRNDEAKNFENIFNNLKSYIPKNDINMNENSYVKKKK